MPSTSNSSQLSGTWDSTLADDGDTLAIGSLRGVSLFTLGDAFSGRPTGATMTNLTRGQPRLQIRIAAPPRVRASVRLLLLAGLGLSRSSALLRRGATATGTHTTMTRPGGSVNIALSTPVRQTTLTLGGAALLESPALRASLSRIAEHGGRRQLTIWVLVKEQNANRQARVTLTITR